MKNSCVVSAWVVGLLTATLTACSAAAKPNVLLLLTDDQRPDTISALGNPHIHTPAMDRLVSQGTAFSRAYVLGAMHGAVCAPSRAMLMTGRSLFGFKENLADTPAWPEQFAKAGYRTFVTGKWHNGEPASRRLFHHGRQVFYGGMSSDPWNFPVVDFENGEVLARRMSAKHQTELFADAAIEFLRDQTLDRPFLCYVAFKSPHDPRRAPSAWHERYRTNLPPVPKTFRPVHPFDNGEMSVRDEKLLPWPRTPEAVRKELGDYYACISDVDQQIGRILATLQEAGLDRNTIIVFASDNGLSLGEHGLMGKQNLYEFGGMHVPVIMAGPGIPQGRRIDALCYLLDVFPTVADLAGVEALSGIAGRSLLPVVRNQQSRVRPALMTAYRHVQRAVRDERWKLIRYPQINRTQLFDLAEDPREMNDLSGNPAFADRVEAMMALLRAQQQELGDTAPLTVENPKPGEWQPPAAGNSAQAPGTARKKAASPETSGSAAASGSK